MALSKNITKQVAYVATIQLNENKEIMQNITIQNAYIQVLNVNGTKNLVNFQIGIYENNEKSNLIYIEDHSFEPTLENGENFIRQAYEYLKTLHLYSDAIDV